MSKIIVLIATMVIAVNLLYAMLPGGSYEKYCKYILGLILILVFAGTITKLEISSDVLDFDNNVPVFESVKITENVQQQTEDLICSNIRNMLKSKNFNLKSISVILEEGILTEIRLSPSDKNNIDEIISLVSAYCDINKSIIMIE